MSDDIKDKIDLIAEESITKISKSKNLNELEDLRIFYLGKKGLVTSFLKTMKDLEQSEKINIGKKLNLLKNKLINIIEEKKLHLNDSLIQKKLLEEKIKLIFFFFSCQHNFLKLAPLMQLALLQLQL